MGFDIAVLMPVIRESISLFVLLVFLFFSYKLLDRIVGIMDNHFGRIVKALEKIADRE